MNMNKEVLEQLIEKRKRLDELKAQSPEVIEAIQLAEECRVLSQQPLYLHTTSTNCIPTITGISTSYGAGTPIVSMTWLD